MRLNALVILSLALVGCGGGGEGAAKKQATEAVTGKVTYRGNPVEGAVVTFSPGEPTPGSRAAFAKTDDEGNYTLTTYNSGDGAIPGKYFVTVTKQAGAARKPDPSEEEYVPPDEQAQVKALPTVDMVPAKYATPTSSGLTFTVPQENYDIQLTD